MYLWRYLEDYPHKLVGEYDEENSPDRFLFENSKKLNLKDKPIVNFEAKKEEVLIFDDIDNNAGGAIKIVSPKLAFILEKYAKDDIELVDVILRTENGDILDYKIVHVIKEVEALNKEESIFSYIPGSNDTAIMSFRKLRLFDDKLKDVNIALLTEYKSYILISDYLKEKIEDFNGVSIFKDEEIFL